MIYKLIECARTYHTYLERHNLGLDEIMIFGAKLGLKNLILSIRKKFINADSLHLQINEEHFLLDKNYRFDENALELKIKLDKNMSAHLTPYIKNNNIDSKFLNANIRLFSDLKFLVKNVENFFIEHARNLRFPKKIPVIQYTTPPSWINEEQKNAIKIIFSHPFCYIWGAPGTGKTQVVLFESLYFYAQSGKKVCILTPTNIALEQVLSTLIKKFKELNFKLSRILRLGVASNKFAKSFPECIEFNENENNLIYDIKTRLQESLIIGMTLDAFIKRKDSLNIKFEHYFLDECAFAPLIKSCALCLDDVPITMLGDHKQLIPICETSQAFNEEHKEMNLWNLSSLFLEDFLLRKNKNILSISVTSAPNLDVIASLTFTHRYGDNIAKILDAYIYKIGLQGKRENTNIFCVDSGAKLDNEGNKISKNEVRAVKKLYAKLKLKYNDIGIITPFNAQKKLLLYELPQAEVCTIHGSQGKEWENVIFSPVSLHYHLSNSFNQKALFGLNVAVSRIKKQIFIVCDRNFWLKRRGQFLRELLLKSQKMNV